MKLDKCDTCDALCCKVTRIFQKMDKDLIRWWEYHGKKVVQAKYLENIWYVDFYLTCKHLEGNRCKIYKKRPLPCRIFDCNDRIYGWNIEQVKAEMNSA